MFVSKLASAVCSPLVAMAPCQAEYFAESRALHQNTGSFGIAASWSGTFGGVRGLSGMKSKRTGEHKPLSHKPYASDETSQQNSAPFHC